MGLQKQNYFACDIKEISIRMTRVENGTQTFDVIGGCNWCGIPYKTDSFHSFKECLDETEKRIANTTYYQYNRYPENENQTG